MPLCMNYSMLIPWLVLFFPSRKSGRISCFSKLSDSHIIKVLCSKSNRPAVMFLQIIGADPVFSNRGKRPDFKCFFLGTIFRNNRDPLKAL